MRNLLVTLLLLWSNASANEIRPFESDGCSSFPDGTFQQTELWLMCCTAHDYRYWMGGTYQERLAADKALEQCVASVGEPEIALLMLAGVRVGGTPYLPTRFRWGYGWPYPRGYKALTEDELRQIETAEEPA
ncbi:MAG: FAD-binding oxidoreductase [Natronospirillum sp.]